MADDIATLGIKVTTKDVNKAARDLNKLEREANQAERTGNKLSSTFKLVSGVFATLGVARLGSEFFRVNKETELLSARLNTLTGSAEASAAIFSELRDLSTQLPISTNELTDAYVKLRNFGIDASRDSLIAFADTAAATGRSLDQFVEAIADATTLEFERLKEFGIKTRQEGDKVKFTFRGITTEVEKSSTEIEKFLVNLSNVNFGGAAEKQINTLAGAVSNLGDSWDRLVLAIGGSSTATSAIKVLSDALGSLANKIAPDLKTQLRSAITELDRLRAVQNTPGGGLGGDFGGFLGVSGSSITEAQGINERIAAQENLIDSINKQIKAQEDAVQKDKQNIAAQRQAAKESFNAQLLEKQTGVKLTRATEEEKTQILKEQAELRKQLLTEEQQNSISAVSNIFGNLASIAREGGKKSFNEYKNFAKAQALVSGALAATNALAVTPTPVGIALATTIAGLTAVQISKIQQQRYAGRALGGQIIAGDTKLVGENGPELITAGPQGASVTPNFKLNNMSGGAEVVINMVNNFGSNGPDAITSIKRALPAIQKMVRSVVQSEISAGGRTSRLLGA